MTTRSDSDASGQQGATAALLAAMTDAVRGMVRPNGSVRTVLTGMRGRELAVRRYPLLSTMVGSAAVAGAYIGARRALERWRSSTPRSS